MPISQPIWFARGESIGAAGSGRAATSRAACAAYRAMKGPPTGQSVCLLGEFGLEAMARFPDCRG